MTHKLLYDMKFRLENRLASQHKILRIILITQLKSSNAG